MGRTKKIKAHRDSLTGTKLRGRTCTNLRLRIEGILWILRTGAPWRDLPVDFGPWQTVYSHFRGMEASGLWKALLVMVSRVNADKEAIMIDSTAMRVHAHGANPAGGQLAQAMGRSKASLSTKIHMACDALGYPLGFILTGANTSDFTQAMPLLKTYIKENAYVIMDKGYDSDNIRAFVNQEGGIAVIALKSNRIVKYQFDEHLYRERHKIENLFARMKVFRRISTRYEKLHDTFAAMVAIVCILIWIKF